MKPKYIKQIEQALQYEKEVLSGKKEWQDVFHNLAIKNAQSWNAETNKKYRNGMPGNSALVKTIKYNDKTHKLEVTYRDNFTAVYDDVTAEEAAQFAKADSKGRWALKHLWSKKYDRK